MVGAAPGRSLVRHTGCGTGSDQLVRAGARDGGEPERADGDGGDRPDDCHVPTAVPPTVDALPHGVEPGWRRIDAAGPLSERALQLSFEVVALIVFVHESSFRSSASARWMVDFTVPTGTPSVSAISRSVSWRS